MLPCLHRVLLRSALSPASGSGLVRTARCIHTTPDRSAAAPPPPPCALMSASSVQSRHLVLSESPPPSLNHETLATAVLQYTALGSQRDEWPRGLKAAAAASESAASY
ncbi:unnamed protein product [Boreogadus saida]